jgi:hypothetical protein
MKSATAGFLCGLASLLLDPAAQASDRVEASRSFDAKIAPILVQRCIDCHSGADPKGGLDLSRRSPALGGGESGAAIVAGKPDESLLWEKIDADEMPPKKPLSSAEKTMIKEWIAGGASWGSDPIDPYLMTTKRRAGRDWWSLQPVSRPSVPPTRRTDWARSPIDSFVLRQLEANRLDPAPEAARDALIRRLSFDLTGLPPTPDEIDTFLADRSTDAYERLVDHFLDSPQYGVRWARWWLDLARYGESNGFEFDEFRSSAWRYRDWVVDSLNGDRPYDDFVRLQLAGDVLMPDDPSAVEATGFLVAGAYDTVGQTQISNAMKAVVRSDEIEDMIGTVGQTFLGLTIHCARCHDHKFDPIRQAEYYRFASALGGVRHGERDLSSIAPETIALKRRIAEIEARIRELEAPARSRILAERKAAKPVSEPPRPIAGWDFDHGLNDRFGSYPVALHGAARISPDGLSLDGKTAYAVSSPLASELKAKTIEAWVRLDNLEQRGGAPLSVQVRDGAVFDAIVFGEQEPGRWMAGSNNFVRTRSVSGDSESEAVRRPLHVAISYAEDGTVQVFRDGQPYGSPYKSSGPAVMPAGETRIAFGLRHAPVGGNRMLAGTIARARIYDRALTPEEVSASAATFGDYIDPKVLLTALSPVQREDRARLQGEVDRLRSATAATSHKAYAVAPRPAEITRIQIRGNPAQPGEIVAAGGVAALVGLDDDFQLPPEAPEADRRKHLADWVTNPHNPLFGRVIANRLWQAHFGAGLVETSSDLGFNGGKPSHPELLDWLAAEIAARGWSLKEMHRLIVTSATYRQSSRSDPEALKRDAGDRLHWRKAPMRLEAEMVRDAMLAVSGRLDTALGGPSFRDHELVQAPGTKAMHYEVVDPATPGLDRRTLYRAWARGGRSTFLDAFDCPDPSTTAPRRPVTTTPLQALAMMNNALVLHLSDAFANRLKREAGNEPEAQVDLAYRLAFGRKPEPAERDRAIRVLRQVGASTLARAIFNSNEFLYVD